MIIDPMLVNFGLCLLVAAAYGDWLVDIRNKRHHRSEISQCPNVQVFLTLCAHLNSRIVLIGFCSAHCDDSLPSL
jgi:hypothetical protein